jgi:DNA helicase-2/ATP-dependent DNA helicase PcrA
LNPPEPPGQSGLSFGAAPPDPSTLLERLNPAQREAVTHGDGPLLVLAGAGSGKTRVITHRIAWLIRSRGVPGSRIVAVTFTNKAAGEMRERIERLVGTGDLGGWIGTFHALCLRVLRRDGARVGLEPGFNIYDSGDQLTLVKRILKDEVGEEDAGTPRSFLSRISRAKNALEHPDEVERKAFTPDRKLLARVYERYQQALRRANAVDFDDLLLKAIELFRNHADVAERYAERCEHLLVDEYQDTNRPQYLLVRALGARHGNICVVGDEDQSIYRFRGAEIRNILDFESDHEDATVIRLEQNYRSSGNILAAAGAVIARNQYRKGKKLWTENAEGTRIELFRADDDRTEAAWVTRRVAELAGTFEHEQLAVLYRTNAQSRQFEEWFRRERIPFQIVGSVQFYERKEVKDVLAYLKLALNPADDVAFRRVVNTPTRGIGDTSLRAVEDVARTERLPLSEAAARVVERRLLQARAVNSLGAFLALIADLREQSSELRVPELIEHAIEAVHYERYLTKLYGREAEDRMENVQGLVSGAVEYEEEEEQPSLEGFLDRSALVADADDVGSEPGVTLMTVHCAKGLEFPVVFLVGLEENLFPHSMSKGSDEDVEEERRLCYVAMTRAQQRLLLSHARHRRIHGAYMPAIPSRFIDEVPPELLDEVAGPAPAPGIWDPGPAAASWNSRGSSAARAARRAPAAPASPRVVRGEDPGDGYAVGAYVDHPRFGAGQIVQREGSGKHLKLTIQFTSYGPKKILPSYTKLEVRAG